MGVLSIIGAVFMGVAAVSLVALALDSAFRHGGEGFLIGVLYAAVAIIPGAICASMSGVTAHHMAVGIVGWSAMLAALVGAFALFLLVHREKEGVICLGIALVAGAALYAIAPGYLQSTETAPAPAATTAK